MTLFFLRETALVWAAFSLFVLLIWVMARAKAPSSLYRVLNPLIII